MTIKWFTNAMLCLLPALSAAASAQDFIRQCGTPDSETRMMLYGPSTSLIGDDCSATSTNPSSQYDPSTLYEVEVVVHIITNTNGTQGVISDAMVDSQIEILNEDFQALVGSPGEPGVYTGIRFRLADTDPNGNPTNGITRHANTTWYNDGGNYWNSIAWDPHRYLNIYTNNGGGALGYVPSLPANGNGSIVGQLSDRVVILWDTFGRNAPNSPYNQGRTVTHEVGHYLGLDHTFEGGCSGASSPGCYSTGDLICDTLPEANPNGSVCSDPATCGDPDPIYNYMDYSTDLCMNQFTQQQMRRMRCTLESWRFNLIQDGTPSSDPVAGFNHTTNGLTVSFSDSSTDADGSVTSWAWNFGDGNSSSAQNPTHTYAADGAYTVTLTVTDNDGNADSVSATVTVNDGSDDVLTSGVPVTGVGAATGEWQIFAIDVPQGATKLEVTTRGSDADADLYVRFNAEPTTGSYNCRSWTGTSNEDCETTNPAAGRWYVGVYAYSTYANLTVTATVTESGGPDDCDPFSASTANLSASRSNWIRDVVTVPDCGVATLTFAISGGSGDADLYVRQGAQPSTSNYDCRPYENGNNETCTFNNPAAGDWHVGVRAYSTFSGVTLSVQY